MSTRYRPTAGLISALALLLAGCGHSGDYQASSASNGAGKTLKPIEVQHCLEKAGFLVGFDDNPGEAAEVREDLRLLAVWKEVMGGYENESWDAAYGGGVGSSNGNGDMDLEMPGMDPSHAVLMMWASPAVAKKAAGEAETSLKEPNQFQHETALDGSIRIGWRDNAAWAAWGNGTSVSETIAGCLP